MGRRRFDVSDFLRKVPIQVANKRTVGVAHIKAGAFG
jgi:hypothetical protein